MNTYHSLNKRKKNFWISITGYRALLLLKALIKAPLSTKKIIEILKDNEVTKKSLSSDTVRITVNTLKNAGCKITKPSKSNNFLYELISHPFCLEFSEKEIKAFNIIREKLAEDLSWQSIFKINKIYDKLVGITFNQELKDLVYNNKPLGDLNDKILYEISNPSIYGRKVNIKYLSVANNLEDIDIIPYKIIYENTRLYLWCYIFKYNTNTMLNISKILKINNVNITDCYENNNTYDVVYKIYDNAVKDFELKDYEEIICKQDNCITVKANVSNEFWFIQRILQFGDNFQIESPEFFKQKLINKIKLIRKRYENND